MRKAVSGSEGLECGIGNDDLDQGRILERLGGAGDTMPVEGLRTQLQFRKRSGALRGTGRTMKRGVLLSELLVKGSSF